MRIHTCKSPLHGPIHNALTQQQVERQTYMQAHLVDGQHSKFTLVTQSYDKRLVNLKLFAWHYSRCTSVSEILVVWNKGTPPDPRTFSSKVPLRFRTESTNSLNNRYNRGSA